MSFSPQLSKPKGDIGKLHQVTEMEKKPWERPDSDGGPVLFTSGSDGEPEAATNSPQAFI